MTYLEAIVLGIVQGLTEFLPVSSSGHLALGHMLFEAEGGGQAFDIVVHGATLLVIFAAFGKIFWSMIRTDPRGSGYVLLALMPSGMVGFLARDQMSVLGHSPWSLGICFAVTGVFLWAVGIFAPENHPEISSESADGGAGSEGDGLKLRELGLFKAMIIGMAQALALAPGISRSGLTISAGRLCGVPAEQAVVFSFVLGAPAILGALLVDIQPIRDLAFTEPGPLAAGFIAALISGAAAMGMLKWVARKGTLPRFAPYCFVLVGLCLMLGAVGK